MLKGEEEIITSHEVSHKEIHENSSEKEVERIKVDHEDDSISKKSDL